MAVNASSYPAPSAATIAAAVAAPSSSTIATAVAAAVPTLSQINTSVSSNAPSSNNWTLISSITQSGAATYTFSGISGYKTLRVICPRITRLDSAGAIEVYIRLNADATASNYSSTAVYVDGTPTSVVDNASYTGFFTGMRINSGNGGFLEMDVLIENAGSIAAPAIVSTQFGYAGNPRAAIGRSSWGQWFNTAAVTSVTITTNSAATMTGQPLYLMGAN